MTVKELIRELSLCDGNLPIVIRAYESGLNEVDRIDFVRVVGDYHPGGDFESFYDGSYRNLTHVRYPIGDKNRHTELDNSGSKNAIYLWSFRDGIYTQ